MVRRLTIASITALALLCASLTAAASAANAARSALQPADNATQTLGSAIFYGTSTPVGVAAAAAAARAARASTFSRRDSRIARAFSHRGSKPRATARTATLQPPAPPGIPVVNSPGNATGFNGLSHRDQRLAGTGQYVNTQPSLEPPDQGLCAGNGFVIEPINVAFAVYDETDQTLWLCRDRAKKAFEDCSA